jgi:hypothetical protein
MRVKLIVIGIVIFFLSSNSLTSIGQKSNTLEFSNLASSQSLPAGDPYIIMFSNYTDGAGDDNLWAVQLRFDIDLGIIESEFDNKSLPLITDEWVEVKINIDLNNDWMKIYYNDELLHQKAWSAGPENTGNGIVNLSAVNLFSDTSTSVYFDDFVLEEVGKDILWSDNFDIYEDGSPIHGQGGWKGWDNDSNFTAYVSTFRNRSYPKGLEIFRGVDIVREYFGNSSGEFVYSVWMYYPDNFAPSMPEITGPEGGAVDRSYDYSFVSTDPELDDVWYNISWGDGESEEWIGPFESGEEIIFNHSWSQIGEYIIRAKARDVQGLESKLSEPFYVTISNPPSAPEIIGPNKVKKGREYDFTFSSADPDGDEVKYVVDWGDELTDETKYYSSGTRVNISHIWTEKGEFVIKAYAVDINNAESNISTIEVSVPKNKATFFHNNFQNYLFQTFSIYFRMIKNLLGC